jgi:ComEC/Rec2-related protein
MRGRLEEPRQPRFAERLFFVAGARDSRRLERQGARDWRALCERYRRRAAARLAAGLEAHPTETALIQAIMLGYRGEIPPALNRAFRNSGTIHVFAISGMHVVVIAWLLTFVVARLGVPRHLWILPLAPLLTIYVWSTGGQPSALRAGVMALLYLAAPLLGRRPDTPSTLALSALLLLAADPFQLHDVGFILSFAVVTGLIVLAAPLVRRLRRLAGLERLALDIEALARLGGEAERERRTLWWRRCKLTTGRYLADLAGVSLAAWLTSAPLTAYYFKLFTPVSLPANLVVVPLSFLVMAAASLSLVAGSLAPALAIVCNRAAWASTAAMTAAARTTASWSWGVIRLPQPPPVWLMAAWYAVLAWWAWSMARADRRADADAAWLEEAARERRREQAAPDA